MKFGEYRTDTEPADFLSQINVVVGPRSTDYTANRMETVLVDCAAASGDVTITLPSPANIGDYVRINLIDTASNRACLIGRNGSMVQKGTSTSYWTLMVPGDAVVLFYTGATVGWVANADTVRGHAGRLSSSAVTSMTGGTLTQINLGTAVFDVGGITNAANNRFVIRKILGDGFHVSSEHWSGQQTDQHAAGERGIGEDGQHSEHPDNRLDHRKCEPVARSGSRGLGDSVGTVGHPDKRGSEEYRREFGSGDSHTVCFGGEMMSLEKLETQAREEIEILKQAVATVDHQMRELHQQNIQLLNQRQKILGKIGIWEEALKVADEPNLIPTAEAE